MQRGEIVEIGVRTLCGTAVNDHSRRISDSEIYLFVSSQNREITFDMVSSLMVTL
jgi:hypothetical protein